MRKVIVSALVLASVSFAQEIKLEKPLSKTFEEIFRFIGIDFVKTKFFYSVPYVDNSARKGYLAEVENTLKEMVGW